jgi:3-dehydroquinate dehydratase-2
MSAIHIAVLHGPNLNLLGTREPALYGTVTLAEIDRHLEERGRARGAVVKCHQTNGEGALVDLIHSAGAHADGIVINPGAYTHTSIAIADALAGVGLPAVEVHLSNLHKRESFRQRSFAGAQCIGTIGGFGARSYYLALDALLDVIEERRAVTP